MIKLIKSLVAISLISFGAVGLLNKNNIIVNVVPIKIEKPSDEVLNNISHIADLVLEKEDRLQIAIFNKEFAERILSYNTDVQQVNDVYTMAGEFYFSNQIKGKYPTLGSEITNLISQITTDENHILSQDEKKSLSENFIGLSWVLVQYGPNKK